MEQRREGKQTREEKGAMRRVSVRRGGRERERKEREREKGERERERRERERKKKGKKTKLSNFFYDVPMVGVGQPEN